MASLGSLFISKGTLSPLSPSGGGGGRAELRYRKPTDAGGGAGAGVREGLPKRGARPSGKTQLKVKWEEGFPAEKGTRMGGREGLSRHMGMKA